MVEKLLGGRYRLEREIGAGGMGRVWSARDIRLDREVAVKTVDLGQVNDPSLADRFQREIVLTARLTSPHAVTVFDGGVDGRTAYLVMELLRGESLADRIVRTGALPVSQALDVARQVTQGLAAAHAVGLVHRDIKPANVMIEPDGRAKLLDFGIAQLTGQADAHLTAPSMTIGTAAYMSPEQAAGHHVDAATDIYALGCLIMTMLTTRPPFDGDQAVAVASQQIHAAPPRVRDRRPDVPPAVDDFVARLLDKDPARRPGTSAAAATLVALANDPAGAATTPSPPVVAAAAVGASATRPYTQVGQPAAAARSLTHLQPTTLGWVAGVLVSLMLALLLAGISANLAGTAAAAIFRGQPGTSPSPSPSPTLTRPTAKPTPTRTSAAPTPKRTPSTAITNPGSQVALAAALQGVTLALNALPQTDARDELLSEWEQASAAISTGQKPKPTLKQFTKSVSTSDLNGFEKQAVLTAVGIVDSLL